MDVNITTANCKLVNNDLNLKKLPKEVKTTDTAAKQTDICSKEGALAAASVIKAGIAIDSSKNKAYSPQYLTDDVAKMRMKGSAEEANASLQEMGVSCPDRYKPGTTVEYGDLKQESQFVRVYYQPGDEASVKESCFVDFFMKKDDIEGLSSKQIQEKYNLPVEPNTVCDVTLNKGTTVRAGINSNDAVIYDLIGIDVNDRDNSGREGSWLMPIDELQGLTPEEIRDKYALPSVPVKMCEVIVPKGTELRKGLCGAIEDWGKGGGTQFHSLQRFNGEFINERQINPNEKLPDSDIEYSVNGQTTGKATNQVYKKTWNAKSKNELMFQDAWLKALRFSANLPGPVRKVANNIVDRHSDYFINKIKGRQTEETAFKAPFETSAPVENIVLEKDTKFARVYSGKMFSNPRSLPQGDTCEQTN